MKKTVYITRPIPEEGIILLKKYFNVTINKEEKDLKQDDFIKNINGKDAVLCMLTNTVNKKILNSTTSIKVFANYAVGYNNIDISEATKLKIAITNTPNVLTIATAEFAWALLMACSRNIINSDIFTRKGNFDGWNPKNFLGLSISGKTLGIIGAGRIGTSFGKLSKGFKMRILYSNPNNNYNLENSCNAKKVSLNTLLKKSDFISIHCPYKKSTHHLIGKDEFNLMKKTAIFINTSRGAIVNEKDLYEALAKNKIFFAGLDVYEKEPKIYYKLKKLKNIILCPHIGSATFDSRKNMSLLAAQSIIDILINNKIPDNCLNKNILY